MPILGLKADKISKNKNISAYFRSGNVFSKIPVYATAITASTKAMMISLPAERLDSSVKALRTLMVL